MWDDDEGEDERPYRVGYGKPPKEYRFKPGNQAAAGKQKRKQKTLTRGLLHKVMDEKVTVVIDGKRVRMSNREALIRNLVNQSRKSSREALRLLELLGQAEAEDFVGVQDHTIKIEFIGTPPPGLPAEELEDGPMQSDGTRRIPYPKGQT